MTRFESRHGWTLLEMLVVIVIVSIVAGGAALNIGAVEGRILSGEGERLAALMTSARDEAILSGQTMRVRLTQTGYRFEAERSGLRVDLAADDLFRPREFSAGIRLERAESTEPREDGETTLIFTPSGNDSYFDLLLTDGKRRVRVRGDARTIHVQPEGA